MTTELEAQTLRTCTVIDDVTGQVGSRTGPIVQYNKSNYKAVSFVATASNTAGASPTLDIVVESCRANNGQCKTKVTFSQCTTNPCWINGYEVADMNRTNVNWWMYFRAVSTMTGVGAGYTYKVELCVDTTT